MSMTGASRAQPGDSTLGEEVQDLLFYNEL